MFSFRAFVDHLKAMRRYFGIALVIFAAGAFIGGTNPAFEQYLTEQIRGIQQIGQTIDASANPMLTMFLFIFFNNAIKSILVMYLGALFGILPAAFLLINGMVIGYLYAVIDSQGENAAMVFLTGIAPHGIIEIPAIIVACAYGLKFGTLGLRGIGQLLLRRTGVGAEYEFLAVRSVPMMVAIVIALLVAAIIESTITLWLVGM